MNRTTLAILATLTLTLTACQSAGFHVTPLTTGDVISAPATSSAGTIATPTDPSPAPDIEGPLAEFKRFTVADAQAAKARALAGIPPLVPPDQYAADCFDALIETLTAKSAFAGGVAGALDGAERVRLQLRWVASGGLEKVRVKCSGLRLGVL